MQFKSAEECRAYVEAELSRVVSSKPQWHAGKATEVPVSPLTWSLGRGVEEGWYTLEARMDDQEFLIWFGNHQVGAELVHWIVRPAVHVAFEDLRPRGDPVALDYTLADVLQYMIASLNSPQQFIFRFEMNTFSLT